MNKFKTAVLENAKISDDIFRIKFRAPQLVAEAKPGRFIEVLCTGQGAPFLRRPFGIHSIDSEKGEVSFLLKRIGRGTEILSLLRPGDIIDIVGPLGNGFDIKKGKTHLIAGGGIGIAPLLFLAQELKKSGEKMQIFLAARTASEVPCIEDFKKCGEVFLATDDGTLGEKCFIDTPLKTALKTASNPVIYACGPHAMLRCVARLGAKTQVLLEEKMACGIGVCQGCAVEVKNKDSKYKMVCKYGPVFDAEDIVW